MATIEKTLVSKLKPDGSSWYIWDDGDGCVTGFGIRAQGNRLSYVYQYRPVGSRVSTRVKLGNVGELTPAEARKLAREKAREVANGGNPVVARRESRAALSVGEVCDKFITDWSTPRKKASSLRNDKMIVERYVKPRFGPTRMRDLDRATVAKLHASMSDTKTQANRVRAFLSKLVEFAREIGEFDDDAANPVRRVKPYKEDKREAQLTVDELARLSEALKAAEQDPATKPAARVIKALLLTGARLGEMQMLRWSHVRLEECRIRLEDSKTGARDIFLGTAAKEFFETLEKPDVGDAWVFPSPWKKQAPVGEVRQVWYAIRAAAELPAGLRLHDLRHVHASLAVSSGVSLYLTGKLLGHRQASTTQRYSHVADEAAQAAADLVSRKIADAMAAKPMRAGQVTALPTKAKNLRRRAKGGQA